VSPEGDLLHRPGVRRRPVAHGVVRYAGALGAAGALRAAQRTLETPKQRRARRDDVLLGAILAALLPPDGTCVDIGASVGSVLAQALRVAPDGRHVAFEPVPEVAAALRTRFPGADIRQAAVGAAPGRAVFELVADDPALSGLRPAEGVERQDVRLIEVDVLDLDSALSRALAPTIVKIDVEGAELAVLSGAAATIERHRPVVVLEHRAVHARRFGTTPAAVHGVLRDLGLRVFDLEGDGPLDPAAFERRVMRDERWNFLARM
jgi:FkbM family methyltransferase